MFKKGDALLVVFFLALAGAIWVGLGPLGKAGGLGNRVRITVDGREWQTIAFSEATEQTLGIETAYGKNSVVIEGGQVRMASADCPDGVCVAHRGVFRNGETIVCLPHRLVVEIQSQVDNDVDAVVQ